MVTKISITISDWLYTEQIKNHPNKSRRIEELIIKGLRFEKNKKRSVEKNEEKATNDHA